MSPDLPSIAEKPAVQIRAGQQVLLVHTTGEALVSRVETAQRSWTLFTGSATARYGDFRFELASDRCHERRAAVRQGLDSGERVERCGRLARVGRHGDDVFFRQKLESALSPDDGRSFRTALN